jgi:hypothetical protein
MDKAVLFGTANDLRVWRYDIRRTNRIQPAKANDLGSVSVRMLCVPARLANKEIPGPSICSFDVQTVVTLLAGVRRVNEDHRHPGSLGLVGDKPTKLSEGPTVQPVTLIPFSPCPFADAVEFFECNAALGALSQRYDAFRNCMIGVGGKSLLFLFSAPQEPFGALGALFLKLLPKGMVSVPDLVQLLPAVAVAIAIKGYIGNTQVNTNHVHDGLLFCIGNVNRNMEKELAVPIDQVTLATRVSE